MKKKTIPIIIIKQHKDPIQIQLYRQVKIVFNTQKHMKINTTYSSLRRVFK